MYIRRRRLGKMYSSTVPCIHQICHSRICKIEANSHFLKAVIQISPYQTVLPWLPHLKQHPSPSLALSRPLSSFITFCITNSITRHENIFLFLRLYCPTNPLPPPPQSTLEAKLYKDSKWGPQISERRWSHILEGNCKWTTRRWDNIHSGWETIQGVVCLEYSEPERDLWDTSSQKLSAANVCRTL